MPPPSFYQHSTMPRQRPVIAIPTEDTSIYYPTDPIDSANFSPFVTSGTSPTTPAAIFIPDEERVDTESTPLLHSRSQYPSKPFLRPRPLWLVPFAIIASIVRGMTVAPRVQVFTQLSCNAIYGHDVYDHTSTPLLQSTHSLYATPGVSSSFSVDVRFQTANISFPLLAATAEGASNDDDEPDPRTIPSRRCLSDAAVQAGAARIQTIMTTIGGLLSALTTGWWGHFGERYGRTRVLAASTLGLFLTDLSFILVSTPHSIWAAHGHKFLVVSPMIEGLLGGWATLQGATSAYVSDCTSDGSRAQIFSRFAGVFYLGSSLGPALGAFLIRHPLSLPGFPASVSSGVHNGQPTVTSVFYVAALCSFVNLLLVLFVFPESLDKKKAEAAREAAALGLDTLQDQDEAEIKSQSVISRLFSPLGIFVPKMVQTADGRRYKDWSLTTLGLALFVYLLSTGLAQMKYLYAGHVYNWGAEKLSYYISFVGAIRSIHLLFIMPFLITTFKPKPKPVPAQPSSTPNAVPGKKPKPTLSQLNAELSFDLWILRLSLFIEFLSHSLVTYAPSTFSPGSSSAAITKNYGQMMFVGFTSLSSLASGISPAANSFALSAMQIQANRASVSTSSGDQQATNPATAGNLGQLFAGLSMLQAVGQGILGPIIFGIMYSTTIARFPKAVFALAAGMICVCVSLVLFALPSPSICTCDRTNGAGHACTLGKKHRKRQQFIYVPYDPEMDVERGRPRASKDLSKKDQRRSPRGLLRPPPISASSSSGSTSTASQFGTIRSQPITQR